MGMISWLRSSSEALRALMAGIKDTQWSWQPEEVGDLCQRMGWKLVRILDGRGALAAADLELPGHQITIVFRDGPVGDIKIQITESVTDSGADRDRFMMDVFADAVDEGVAVLGEPTARQRTKPPAVRWRTADSTVLVENVEGAVLVTWATNKWQDEWDEITEALA
jgi:hypothetical protein